MFLLANTAVPDAKGFLDFWIIIAFLAGIAVNVATLFKVTRTQKREVSFTFVPASKEEFDRHVEWNAREHENLFKKIGGVERGAVERMDQTIRELTRTDSEARKALHARINEILSAVSELRGEMQAKRNRD